MAAVGSANAQALLQFKRAVAKQSQKASDHTSKREWKEVARVINAMLNLKYPNANEETHRQMYNHLTEQILTISTNLKDLEGAEAAYQKAQEVTKTLCMVKKLQSMVGP